MSDENHIDDLIEKANRVLRLSIRLLVITAVAILYTLFYPDNSESQSKQETAVITPIEIDEDRIEDGIHVRTGLIDAEGMMLVVNNCTNCHSSKIIIQNRMTTEGWNATIKWMQETQNLWDLGDAQEQIVNYLVTNYPVKAKGRRENLSGIEWYVLED